MSRTLPFAAGHSVLRAVIMVALSIPLMGASVVVGQSPSSVPGSGPDGVVGTEVPEPSLPTSGDDGATLVTPDPALINQQPIGWDHIVVAPDGQSLTVYFWNGVADCYGLAKVDVTPAQGGADVQLYSGSVPPGTQVCIEIAQLYKVEVLLDSPVIGGGAKP
jgi:hypothetical protein